VRRVVVMLAIASLVDLAEELLERFHGVVFLVG